MLSQLVFQETLVRFLDVLREITEERKCRELGRKLCHILDFHELALPHRRRIVLDFRQHGIHELGCGNLVGVIGPHVAYFIEHIQDSLLLEH